MDAELVRRLVAGQLPQWADLPVRPLDSSGSSNALFRLGEELLVRVPRQRGGGDSVRSESRWAPTLAQALPVAVPEVVALGSPTASYPENWSVVRWLEGDTPGTPVAGAAGIALAHDLAAVVQALRELAVPTDVGPDLHWYRAEPLAGLDRITRSSLVACRGLPDLDLDLEATERIWDDAMALPSSRLAAGRSWLHADLLAENLLVRDGRLSALLDLGGVAVGDPTVDLVVAWEVLDAEAREVFRREVAVDEETWLRGRAWALGIALMTFPYYWDTMPDRCAARLAMARAVLADHSVARAQPTSQPK